MLFVHGFPELWYSWRYQMEEFADEYDVVAVDQRGYNDSGRPEGVAPYRLQQLAADVKGLVTALGHETCTLVAHDWGGVVAWVVSGMYGPALVERLIIMGLPHTGLGFTNFELAQAAKSSYILQFQAPWLPEASLTVDGAASMDGLFLRQPAGVVNSGAMTEGDVAWYKDAMLKPGAATAMLNYYRAFMRTVTLGDQPGDDDVWRALRARLGMPALLLHGDRDVALGVKLLEGSEAVFDEAAGGSVEVKLLKDCSHWVQQDYPLQVNGIMRDWLRRQDARAAASR
ncbi:MAG: alpha/beta hydrolase fold protein [Monoraphidium minutum]|nr:MAG: alpha/beta hydrolase fold protein [Monoraphidium minutum]